MAAEDTVLMRLEERPTKTTVRDGRWRVPGSDAIASALDVLELHRLSPLELRILLAARDGEVTLTELAADAGRSAARVRRSAGSLFARGLVRWRYVEDDDGVLSLTYAGRAVVRGL